MHEPRIHAISKTLSRLLMCPLNHINYVAFKTEPINSGLFFFCKPGEARYFLGGFEATEERPKDKRIIDVEDGFYISLDKTDILTPDNYKFKTLRKLVHAG